MISVIIPTYQRYELLKEAVSSVLSQTYQDIEIIVVDDFSNDETRKIAEFSPKVVYLCNEKNSGPGYSRRRGLLCCKGEYVVFLDDDDYYTDYCFFEKAISLLKKNATYIFVAGNAHILHAVDNNLVEDKLDIIGAIDGSNYLEGFPFKYKKPHSTFTTIFKKDALFEAGVDKMEMLNDMSLYMRSLTVGGTVFFMEDTIGVYRIHNTNISKAMTWDFIRANLEEKHFVKKQIEQDRLFRDTRKWWLEQIKTTVGYYVYGTHPYLHELKKVERWCIINSEDKQMIRALFKKYKDYLIDYRICALKLKIKKALGMK